MPRLERSPAIPLPKGAAGGKAEAGATDPPRCCPPHGAPLPARAVNWEVGVAWKQQFGTGVTS